MDTSSPERHILTPPPEQDRWEDLSILDRLDRLRAPLDGLSRAIVHGVLHRYLPTLSAGDRLVEIGSGGGQLRAWLPPEMLPHLLHTEPSPAYVARLRQRYPEAAIEQASVYALPLKEGSQTVVLALCTFDALQQPERARDEIRRVLRPGGFFVHFLDLGADLELLFLDLIARGDMPLPNFLAEEVLLHHAITPEQRELLPTLDPLDDLLAVKQTHLSWMVRLLERTRQPVAGLLRPYLCLFDPARLDGRAAVQSFMELVSDRPRLAEMNRALLSIYLTARAEAHRGFLPMEVRRVSSLEYLRQKMTRVFCPEEGFTIELMEVLRKGEIRQRDKEVPEGCRYKARWVGKSVVRTSIPTLPGVPLESIDASSPGSAPLPGENEYLLESALFVLAARKRE